jgi:hypothetical protein
MGWYSDSYDQENIPATVLPHPLRGGWKGIAREFRSDAINLGAFVLHHQQGAAIDGFYG